MRTKRQMMAGYVHRGAVGDNNLHKNGKANVINPNIPTPSPLVTFVKAKEKINNVFSETEHYVAEALAFLKTLAEQLEFVDNEIVVEADGYARSVRSIKDMLKRDHMKVVVFGRTSNGKSSVINAMLHAKVLPSGMGHTTRCFLQVEGSDSDEKYVQAEGSTEKRSLESIDELAHALTSQALGEDTLVQIFWPKKDSKFLQNEVVLVDSPGVDVSPEFDSWIDKHCLDADVFVLICNAESTLTQTEKNFFHRVSEKISKPNIFILNNRWDASAAEPESMDQVRRQHTSRLNDFLVNELQACSAEEAKNRIFFVSAREMLQSRLKDKGLQSPSKEFASELCISNSAINTKFEAHIEKGKKIVTNLKQVLDGISATLSDTMKSKTQEHEAKMKELHECLDMVRKYARDTGDRIRVVTEEVQLKSSSEVVDEVKRLPDLIDNFHRSFTDEPHALQLYKQELTEYADKVISGNLTKRVQGSLLPHIMATEQNMLKHLCGVLPQRFHGAVTEIIQYRKPFQFSFIVNCPQLMESFHEDLEFRFSLGFSSLVHKFARIKSSGSTSPSKQQVFGSSNMIPRPVSTPDVESVGFLTPKDLHETEDAVMKSIILTSASYVANGGIGLLLVGGLIYRTVGWRAIALCGSIYGGLYVYERLSWNNRAKESSFKNQYTRHLAARLRHLNSTITMNCSTQINRELMEYFERLQRVAVGAQDEMKSEADEMKSELKKLEKYSKDLSQTKGKAAFLHSDLESFEESFLKKS